VRPRTAGLAAAGLVAAAVGAQAQEFSMNRPGSGARSAGMGNAFIALSDDGTAASWNPAGLSQLRKPEFSLVYNTSHRGQSREGYRTRDGSAAYTTMASSSTDADLEFASAAVPFGVGAKAVTLQVGWRRLSILIRGAGGHVASPLARRLARRASSASTTPARATSTCGRWRGRSASPPACRSA
jgi:hypothetical protein